MVFTISRILSCGVWLMLMRNTSAPASNSLRIIALSEEAGPRVARILMRRRRLIICASLFASRSLRQARRAGWRTRQSRQAGPARSHRARKARHALRRLLVGLRQLHRPGSLLSGVDLEKPGAVEAARQAVLGPLDGEFLVA